MTLSPEDEAAAESPRAQKRRRVSHLPVEFEHTKREGEIYKNWAESGAFHADVNSTKPPYMIAMPPPNATGPLHIGHAMTLTIEDVISRWRRMSGDEVLWLPGTDHGPITTERTVAKQHPQLQREELQKKIKAFVDDKRATIWEQMRALGSSCDWLRMRNTLDPQIQRVVQEVFCRMYRAGLIYRGYRIVNWDVDLRTAISEDEIHTKDEEDAEAEPLYFIRYGSLQVATHRPELRLADTALAVHPEDEEYRHRIGDVEMVRRPDGTVVPLKIVGSSTVNRHFGTGVVGVTPAHDPEDFELAKRHYLRAVQVIGDDGRMTEAAGKYKNMTARDCRKAFMADLRAAGLEAIPPKRGHKQKLRYLYRGGSPLEYLPKREWFIDVDRPAVRWEGRTMSFRELLAEAIASPNPRLRFDARYEKEVSHWVERLRDWCISRHISWGHRLPVWYRGDSEIYVGARPPEMSGWQQEKDTLDSWFSSALWTWSTLVDLKAAEDFTLTFEQVLEQSRDYQRFHPTRLFETGKDLIFGIVRMILLTTYATGRLPFEKVYLHGLIKDAEGRKMSTQRKGFSTDPRAIIKEKGADTLRLALVGRSNTDKDAQLTDDKITAAQRFVRKLWSAADYVMEYGSFEGAVPSGDAHPLQRWMLRMLGATAAEVTAALDGEIGRAADLLRAGFRADFCDTFIEASKKADLRDAEGTKRLLGHGLEVYLQLLHPFIPFVTDELWRLTGHQGMLMQHSWPGDGGRGDGIEGLRFVSAIQKWRVRNGQPWSAPLELHVSERQHAALARYGPLLAELAYVTSIRQVGDADARNLSLRPELRVKVVPVTETR